MKILIPSYAGENESMLIICDIGELLSQICDRILGASVRNRSIPFALGEIFALYVVLNVIKYYEADLTNALYWTHYKCELTNTNCFHYDIWAYAKIFYHLELYNKPRLDEMHREYLEMNNVGVKGQEN